MTVLVAYDGSGPAKKALRRAFADHPDGEVVLLRVVEAAEGSTGAGLELLRERFRDRREELKAETVEAVDEVVDTRDVEYRTEVAVGRPDREIVRFAEREGVDHIYVGSHGRGGVPRVLLGSVAERVVRRAPVPVTVVR